jgi:hypothetical protein
VRRQENQRLVCILVLQALQRRPIDVKRPSASVQRAQPPIKEELKEWDLDAHQRPQGGVRLLARLGQPFAYLLGDDGKLGLESLTVQHLVR